MCQVFRKTKMLRIVMTSLVFAVAITLFLPPDTGFARRAGNDGNRDRFYGVVQSMPTNCFHGEWVIGGRTVTTSSGTQFDQSEGNLAVGGCAKVDIRNGSVHEIDSEPMRDCR